MKILHGKVPEILIPFLWLFQLKNHILRTFLQLIQTNLMPIKDKAHWLAHHKKFEPVCKMNIAFHPITQHVKIHQKNVFVAQILMVVVQRNLQEQKMTHFFLIRKFLTELISKTTGPNHTINTSNDSSNHLDVCKN